MNHSLLRKKTMAAKSAIIFALTHLPTAIKLVRTGFPLLLELMDVLSPRQTITAEELMDRMCGRRTDVNERADAKADEIRRSRD